VKKRSAWRRFKRRAGASVGRALGPAAVKLVARTWRVRFVNAEARDARDAQGRLAVYSFWHQNILAAVGTHAGYPVRVLVSLHRDGETIAQLAERLGCKTIRGSTHGGGAAALREMVKAAEETPDGLGFTPDGPRGPARSIAPGVIALAAAAHRPLVASGFACSRFWQARSWDRMLLPKPFARLVVAFERLPAPPPDSARQGAAHDAARAQLAQAMDAAAARARAELEAWIGRPAPEIVKS
jgi:lysophospholipid acyltransferase (LPLAT)-like uncharacterized protein